MSIILILLLSIAGIGTICMHQVSAARDIYVDSGYKGYSDGTAEKPYKSIQEAIDIASTGDTIYVFGGTYDETIIIDKKLNLWGSIDSIPSIIDTREDKRYTVEITADYAKFQEFTVSDIENRKSSPIGALVAVRALNVIVEGNYLNNTTSYGVYLDNTGDGSVVVGNSINNANHGIQISDANTIDIISNQISDCITYGIHISGSTNSRLYDNNITTSTTGVAVVSSPAINITNNTVTLADYAGLHIEGSTGAIIRHNILEDNIGVGLYLDTSGAMIYSNQFNANERGITLVGSSSLIYENMFSNHTASGIYALSTSTGNIIYQNRFDENGKSAEELGKNTWYYLGRGNYWDDYGGIDRDIDGIGDTSYRTNGVVDDFPLGYFLKAPEKPITPSPEDAETSVGLKITFKVKVEDEDSEQMTVYFYKYIEDQPDTLIGTAKRVNSGQFASCNYVQPFDTTFLWYAIANDSILENRSDIWFFTTMATPPNNIPPVAHPGGPYIAKPEQTILFDGSQSSDLDGEVVFYRWNFGDGSSQILARQPTHSYHTNGDYTVSLTVIDDNGTSATASTTVTITGNPNVHPTADAGGPYSAITNELVFFSGVNSTDTDGTIVEWYWDFGDGSIGYDEFPTHSYTSKGTYLVILTVTDDAGDSSSAQAMVTITEPEPETPGFQLVFLMLGSLMVALVIRRKKKTR